MVFPSFFLSLALLQEFDALIGAGKVNAVCDTVGLFPIIADSVKEIILKYVMASDQC